MKKFSNPKYQKREDKKYHQRNERKGRTTKHLLREREGKEKNDDIRFNNQYSKYEYY
tara:strand:- start:4414 stop:4584 length:171 start_codon:yes stop_codon:yes gene_type:complete